MTEEFVLHIRVAANALLTARPCSDGIGPVLRLHWQNKDICLATEALWCMYATMLPQGVACKVEQDDGGFIVIPTKRSIAPLYRNVSLQEFPGSISRMVAFARSGWKLMDIPTVLSWPFYNGSDKNAQLAALPSSLGRGIVHQYRNTHFLLTRRADAKSKFDVFMRMMAKAMGLPSDPDIWFGRVQYDLFYALVRHSHANDFIRMVNYKM